MPFAKFRQAGHLRKGRTPKTQGWGDELSQWGAGKSLSREESCLEEPVVPGSSKWYNPLFISTACPALGS